MKLPKSLRTLAFAGIGGIAVAAATATVASAYTYTQCDRDGDYCWRVRCDNDGAFCHRTGYFHSGYYTHRYYTHDRRWVCNRYGGGCHWAYGYDRPRIGFGLSW